MKVLLIDIDDSRANKIDSILASAGIELINFNNRGNQHLRHRQYAAAFTAVTYRYYLELFPQH